MLRRLIFQSVIVAAMLALLVACGARTGLFAPDDSDLVGGKRPDASRRGGGDDDDDDDDDFDGGRPGQVPEGAVCKLTTDSSLLGLANDLKLTASDYVAQCSFTQAQAEAVVANRPFATVAALEAVLADDDPTFCSNLSACAEAHARANCAPGVRSPVVLELVVDESGSMTGAKWEGLRDALLLLFDDLAADSDPDLQIGLVTFESNSRTDVAPGTLSSFQLDRLRTSIDKPDPRGGGTNTIGALETAYRVVNNSTSVRHALLLLSDGSPTRGSVEKQECIDRANEERRDRQNLLFSIGIGQFPSDNLGTYDPAFMGRLAQSGGTAPAGCRPDSASLDSICHYQVTPGNDSSLLRLQLTAALDAIRTAVVCP